MACTNSAAASRCGLTVSSLDDEAEIAAKSVKAGKTPSIFRVVKLRLNGCEDRYVLASSDRRSCNRSSSLSAVEADCQLRSTMDKTTNSVE
jgi:hypothetical protein